MDTVSSGDESNAEPMHLGMLEDIRDNSHSCMGVNRRKARYNIRDFIKQSKL